jgi:uncharacterized membrane protein (DUF4010 family)
MPDNLDPRLAGLLLALAIGFLIGIERGWRQRGEEAGARVAGIRTFSIVGLIGGLIGLEAAGPLRLVAGALAAGTIGALVVGYHAHMRRDDRDVSATSTLAAMVTLALGAMATSGGMELASIGAGAMMFLLASRKLLHRAIRFTSEDDLQALLRLVLVVLVILPLLPDRGMGPYGALNPQRLWMVVVITGAVAFIGYGLARWLGRERGTLVTAVVGALVSSTAVTLDSARRIREGTGGPADQAAVAVASAIMLGRALLMVALLAPFAIAAMAIHLGLAVLVGLVAAAALLYRASRSPDGVAAPKLQAPGLGLALVFAATVAVLAVVSAWAQATLGAGSGALVIALGGTADVDAAIAAVGALPAGTLAPRLAALALAAPVLFNTLLKAAILVGVAGWRTTIPALASLAATAVALLVPIAISLANP